MTRTPVLMLSIILVVAGLSGIAAGQADTLSLERKAWFVSSDEVRVQLTISGASAVVDTLQALGLEEQLPEGFVYNGVFQESYGKDTGSTGGGSDKEAIVNPRPNSLEFYWIDFPIEFPVQITYGLTVQTYTPGGVFAGTLFAFSAVGNFDIPSPETPVSAIACLTFTRSVPGGVYVPGQNVTVSLNLQSFCPEPVQALSVTETVSTAWLLSSAAVSYPLSEGAQPEVALPQANTQSPFVFEWVEPPLFPAIVSYTLIVPGTATGPVQLGGEANYILSGPEIVETIPVTTINSQATPPPQTGSLSGVVRNSVTRLPLSGALIRLMPGGRQTTSALAGFSMGNIPVGAYTLTVTREGFQNYRENITLSAGINLKDILLVPVPDPAEGEGEEPEVGSLAGVVRSEDTQLPLANVLIQLSPGDYETNTSWTGSFVFTGLPAGKYTLSASRTDLVEYTADIQISGGINLLDISMTSLIVDEGEGEEEGETEGEVEGEVEGEGETPAPGVLNGAIRNADTELPIFGAVVTLMPGAYEQTSNRQGVFSFGDLAPGLYTIAATFAGYADFSADVDVDSGENGLDIYLSPLTDEGEGESEGEGEPSEGEPGEGEEPDDDGCTGCCASESKHSGVPWHRYLGDFFLLGMAMLLLTRFNKM